MRKIYNSIKITSLLIFLTAGLVNAQYANGVIISNEGNFGQTNADVSYLDAENLQVTNNLYATVNNENLGDVLQNVGFYGDNAYLVCNNSNKIVVVDRETFVKQAVITNNIHQPRYIAFANGKLYVTSSSDHNVSVFDIATNTFLSEIMISSQVEELQTVGNQVFVQNGWYGTGNNIIAIDAITDAVVQNIPVEEGVNGIKAYGDFLFSISSNSEFTHIYQINGATMEIVNDARFDNIAGGKKISVEDDIIYFVGGGNTVYALPISLDSEPIALLSENEVPYSTFYGFNVILDYIFSGNASSFAAPSVVTVYDLATQNQVLQFNTTMGVNGFYANLGNMEVNEMISTKINVNTYPNPVVDYVNISGLDAANISVFNMNGEEVKKMKFNGEALNVSELVTGLYFFVIETENSKVTKKVLVK